MKLSFPNTARDRPMVLNRHQFYKLSAYAGRDVTDELQAICMDRYEVKTFNGLLRALKAILKPPVDAETSA